MDVIRGGYLSRQPNDWVRTCGQAFERRQNWNATNGSGYLQLSEISRSKAFPCILSSYKDWQFTAEGFDRLRPRFGQSVQRDQPLTSKRLEIAVETYLYHGGLIQRFPLTIAWPSGVQEDTMGGLYQVQSFARLFMPLLGMYHQSGRNGPSRVDWLSP